MSPAPMPPVDDGHACNHKIQFLMNGQELFPEPFELSQAPCASRFDQDARELRLQPAI